MLLSFQRPSHLLEKGHPSHGRSRDLRTGSPGRTGKYSAYRRHFPARATSGRCWPACPLSAVAVAVDSPAPRAAAWSLACSRLDAPCGCLHLQLDAARTGCAGASFRSAFPALGCLASLSARRQQLLGMETGFLRRRMPLPRALGVIGPPAHRESACKRWQSEPPADRLGHLSVSRTLRWPRSLGETGVWHDLHPGCRGIGRRAGLARRAAPPRAAPRPRATDRPTRAPAPSPFAVAGGRRSRAARSAARFPGPAGPRRAGSSPTGRSRLRAGARARWSRG